MRRRSKILLAVSLIFAALVIAGYAAWRHHFPYGCSHCCDLCLSLSLRDYAELHDGAFPAGEATPEASLSLLYREKQGGYPLADANLLRGKTVPESVVKEILERGDLLTPETCGWHYVEGLRLDDDPHLAVFWDKIGLDHNGGLLAEGGHIVLRVNGSRDYIPEADWVRFLSEQERLLAERKTAVHYDAKLRSGDSTTSVHVFAADDCIYGSTHGAKSLSREFIAATKVEESGIQQLPIIPIEEFRKAKVVVEQDLGRVRFVLRGHEIIFDGSRFRVVETADEPTK